MIRNVPTTVLQIKFGCGVLLLESPDMVDYIIFEDIMIIMIDLEAIGFFVKNELVTLRREVYGSWIC